MNTKWMNNSIPGEGVSQISKKSSQMFEDFGHQHVWSSWCIPKGKAWRPKDPKNVSLDRWGPLGLFSESDQSLTSFFILFAGLSRGETSCHQKEAGKLLKSLEYPIMKPASLISLASRMCLIMQSEQPWFPGGICSSGNPIWRKSRSLCSKLRFYLQRLLPLW